MQGRVPFLIGVLHYSMYMVMYSHEITAVGRSFVVSPVSPIQSVMKPIAT